MAGATGRPYASDPLLVLNIRRFFAAAIENQMYARIFLLTKKTLLDKQSIL
jgi:hypothetical protein